MCKNFRQRWSVKKLTLLMSTTVLLNCMDLAAAPTIQVEKIENVSWKIHQSIPGKCFVSFPAPIEYISEKMPIPEQNYELKYDAYVSSLSEQTVFMLLIAQLPQFVDSSYAQLSLESFLTGILTHNPGNQLLSADPVVIEGNEGIDFFIKTGSVYFKGRAIIAKNSLYLIGMECEMDKYKHHTGHFDKFVESFNLVEEKIASNTP